MFTQFTYFSFFLFIFGTIGLSNILVHGEILNVTYIRPFLKWILPASWFQLFECYECTGWWSGLVMGFLLAPINYMDWSSYLVLIPCAFSGAALGHMYTLINNFIQSKTDFVIEDEDG